MRKLARDSIEGLAVDSQREALLKQPAETICAHLIPWECVVPVFPVLAGKPAAGPGLDTLRF